MYQRPEPLEVPADGPYVTIDVVWGTDAVPLTFRRPAAYEYASISAESSAMLHEVIDFAAWAKAVIETKEGDEPPAYKGDPKRDGIKAHRLTAARHGLWILNCWHDPVWVLECQDKYRSGEYAADPKVDPAEAAGLACVDELHAAGWSQAAIAGLGEGLAKWSARGREVDGTEVRRIADFFAGATI